MIIKLLIIGVVIVSGILLIYPDELIQFSKGSTIQETTEQSFSNLKDSSINEIGDSIIENLRNGVSTIKNTMNNFFNIA